MCSGSIIWSSGILLGRRACLGRAKGVRQYGVHLTALLATHWPPELSEGDMEVSKPPPRLLVEQGS